jgi:hypothetical protein
MIEMVIDSIRVSLMSQQRIVILREVDAERYLAIWIGIYEAEAIAYALQEVEVARPLTWDLLKNVFGLLGARLVRVEVVSLQDNTYFGNLVVETADRRTLNIDSRPSDALALAVRAHVPIMVAEEVLREAGILPDQDLQRTAPSPRPPAPQTPPPVVPGPESESGSGRLSIFEDFLDQLDLDKLSGEEGDDKTPDQ